jgi:GWxTD domain-containing protein
MRFYLYLLLVILLPFCSLPAQTGFIPLSIDHAIFRGNEEKVYLEIYLSFSENNLNYVEKEDQYIAEYTATVQILQQDSLLFQKIDRRKSTIDSLQDISLYRKFLNAFAFSLDPGSYQAKIIVQDENSARAGEYLFDFICSPFSKENLSLSTIELCSKIKSDTIPSAFQKNSYLTIPNPGSLFDVGLPVMYYYAELYNLDFSDDNPGQYKITVDIKDLAGNVVKSYPERIVTKPGKSAVIVGGHNIVTLPASTYTLNMEVQDLQSNETSRASKRFAFLKPGAKQADQPDSADTGGSVDLAITQYLQFDENSLDQEFEKTKYISTKKEREIYKNLSVDGKRVFLAKFWKKFDPTPTTEINEFKQNYFELIQYAELNFSSMNKEGWETDRGRVLLTYGSPSEIERFYMSIDMKPHEIWHYHELEGGVIFVFADLTGFGDFDLLHSTYSKELYQPDWERLVRKTQAGYDFDQR